MGAVYEFDVLQSAAASFHVLGQVADLEDQDVFDIRKECEELVAVAPPLKVHVSHFGGAHHFRMETTSFTPEFRTAGSSSHHRTFFYDHGHHIGATVDHEVGGHPVGHIEIGQGIFRDTVKEALGL